MRHMTLFIGTALLGTLLGCASSGGAGPASGSGPSYLLKGEQMEGCECDLYCPCVFSRDASFDNCRALFGWKVAEGHYAGTNLSGLTFAAAVTKTGKNIEKTMGKWEGVVYLPQGASEKQREGIVAILKAQLGSAFAKLEVKNTEINAVCEGERHSLTVGKIAALKSTALKGADGKVTLIVNAPSPVALPLEHCAKADVHTYDDGTSKWDFAGRNAFYGDFEMKSK